MTHHCAAIVTCMDYRLHQRADGRNCLAEFVKGLHVDCDFIARAGGILDLVRPESEGFSGTLLRDAEVAAKLHAADPIILINHEDCGAYRARMHFRSREEQIAQHHHDLEQAMQILAGRFPGKTVRVFLAELKAGTEDEFLIRPSLQPPSVCPTT
ncbi:MAG: carbonic anhydrase [bacterium]